MSQIGNYIHRTFDGYVKEGITENGSFMKWKEINYANFFKDVPEDRLQSITKKLKALLNEPATTASQKSKNSYKTYQAIERYFNEELQRSESLLANTASIKVYSGGWLTVNYDNDALILKNEFENFKNRLKNISRSSEDEQLNQDLLRLRDKVFALAQQKNKPVDIIGTDVEAIYKAIAQYLSYPPINLYKGTLAELLTTVVAQGSEAVASNVNILPQNSKQWTGQSTVTREVSQDIKETFQGMTFSVHHTQSKADVLFTWDDEVFGASVKNYYIKNSSSEIKIHSSGQLYYLFGDSPDFIAHFINLFVDHTGRKSSQFQDLQQEMKQDFYYRAIAYGLRGKEQEEAADIFILVQRGTMPDVKVLSAKKIFANIQRNPALGKVQVGGQDLLKTSKSIYNQNAKSRTQTKEERRAKALSEAQNKAITAYIIAGATGI